MTISNSVLFKQAHAMTKQANQAGDDYRVTFGACLKAIKADMVEPAPRAPRKISIDWSLVGMCSVIIFGLVLFFTGLMAISQMGDRNKASFDALYADDTRQTVTADDSLDGMFDELQKAIDDSGVEGITIIR